MSRQWTRTMAALIGMTTAGGSIQCVAPECASPDYTNPECRVIEENEVARLRTSTLVEVRFQEPGARTNVTWEAGGLLQEIEPGRVRARVAGPGDFALSLERRDGGARTVQLELDNVDPDAVVSVGPRGGEVDLPPPSPGVTRRELAIDLSADAPVWVRGRRSCPSRYRIAVLADIQTNPGQFERIIDRLQDEVGQAEALGEPLVGLLVNGDISEASRQEEFDTVQEILRGLPVPAAVTAGNHDVFRPLRPLYNRNFGPGNHAFTICRTRVVMLDTGSGRIARSVEGRLPELFDRRGADFLVAGMHHAPYPGLTGAGWSNEAQAQHVLTELAMVDADLVVTGHYHALRQFEDIDVGDTSLREIIAGTAGAHQGAVGVPRYGYVRLTFDTSLEACFVEVPPPGYDGPANGPVDGLPYCDT